MEEGERDTVIYRRLEREVKGIASEARRRIILKQVEKADPQTGECWQLLRALGKGVRIPATSLKDGDSFIFDDKGKAELAASFFTDAFSNRKETGRRLQTRAYHFRNDVLGLRRPCKEFPKIATERIESIIKSRGRKSAPGKDGISFKALGNLHVKTMDRLRDIIQVSFEFGEVPDCWKAATVVLNPQKGKEPGSSG